MSEAEVAAYIESLPEPRRAQVERLHRLIREAAPDLDPKLWDYSGTLIAYGTYHYKTKTRQGEWFPIGVASRKAYVSLYSMAMLEDGVYYTNAFAQRLGIKGGNSCLNLKNPDAIDEATLREFIAESARAMREHSVLGYAGD